VKKRGSVCFSPGLLTKAITQAGLNESDLGRLLGLPRRDIAHYTNGSRRPTLRRVAEMALHLDIEPTALMDLPAQPTMESLRESRMLERADVTEATQIDFSTLHRLETGQSQFKDDDAQRLAELYDTDFDTVTAAIATSHQLHQNANQQDRVQSVRLRLATSTLVRLDEVRGDQSRVEWIRTAIWRAKPTSDDSEAPST